MSLTSDLVESYIQSQARDFLRPRTPLERLQLIFTVIWFTFAFFGNQDIQAVTFFLVLGLISINSLQLIVIDPEIQKNSFFGNIFRFTIFFWLFLLIKKPEITNDVTNDNFLVFDYTFDTIIQMQIYLISSLIILGLLFRYLRLELLKKGSILQMRDNYLDFFFQAFKGIGYAAFLIVIFSLFQWLPELAEAQDFPNKQDLILILGSLGVILASQGPQGAGMQQIMIKELFLVAQNRFERLRDACLGVGIIILSIIHLTPMLNAEYNIYNVIWSDIALIMFLFGIISFFLGFSESKQADRRKGLSGLADGLTQKTMDFNMPETFQSVKDSVKDAKVDPNKQQFFKLNQDLPIINKENTQFTAKKNSVAIPVKDTPEGTAVVLVGESELKQKDQSDKIELKNIDGATTVIIPHKTWQDAYQTFEAIKPSEETIQALALKGIESREKLIELAQKSLIDFQNWKGPQALRKQMQGLVGDLQSGKYGVIESSSGTNVRLPGITVLESPEATFVRVLGIKVLELRGQTIVSMPFIKVMETADYDFVKLPGITVIDAKGSELVSVMGFRIQSGDPKVLAETIAQIEADQLTYGGLLDQQVDSILDSPETLLLSTSTAGKKMELLTGSGEEKALVSDISSIATRKNKKKKRKGGGHVHVDIEIGSKSKRDRRKVRPSKRKKASKEWIDEVTSGKVDIQEGVIEGVSDQQISSNQELIKFQKILRMSKGEISLSRLARQLNFDTDMLEDWLISLDIDSLQIDWESEKFMVTDELKAEIDRLVQN
jgi:hypothetical protein